MSIKQQEVKLQCKVHVIEVSPLAVLLTFNQLCSSKDCLSTWRRLRPKRCSSIKLQNLYCAFPLEFYGLDIWFLLTRGWTWGRSLLLPPLVSPPAPCLPPSFSERCTYRVRKYILFFPLSLFFFPSRPSPTPAPCRPSFLPCPLPH